MHAWYVICSTVVLICAIYVMVEEDKENAELLYPPIFGYYFKDFNGKFRVSRVAWVFMLATAPYTNMVVIPALTIFMLFFPKKKKE